MEPIKGGRFTCSDCDNIEQDEFGEYSVDFCLDCAPKGLILDTKPNHKPDHILRPVRRKLNGELTTLVDKDYLYQTDNYLDPNYVK